MRFADDVYAQFDSGFRTPYRVHIELAGDKGTINIPMPFQPYENAKIILKAGDTEEVITIPGEHLYLGEVENMADAILNGAPTRMSLQDSRDNVLTIQTLLRSAKEGRPITM
jgi:predicted dehydrogenase